MTKLLLALAFDLTLISSLYCAPSALAVDPVAATSQTAPAPLLLTGPAAVRALDQLATLRAALRTHVSGHGTATDRFSRESSTGSSHSKSRVSFQVTFAFDADHQLIRLSNDDPKIGFAHATLQSGPVVVVLTRPAAPSPADKVDRRYWQIYRYSEHAVAPQGKPTFSFRFARGDEWTYRAIVGLPGSSTEDGVFKGARNGDYKVFRRADTLIIRDESSSPHLGKFTDEYVFSLSQGGVLLRASFTHESYASSVFTYTWAQTPNGAVIPATFTMRITEMSMDRKAWHVIKRDVTFDKFELGPVPGKDLSIRALGPPGGGIPAGTYVTDYAGQQKGQRPPTFVYSEPTWQRIIGEDPAQEMSAPAPR